MLLPSLQSALPFLDLHGTPRLEFHQSVFDELRDKLLERVSAIASEGKAEERSVRQEAASPARNPQLAALTSPWLHIHPEKGAASDTASPQVATFSLVLCHFLSNVSFPRYKKLEDLLEKSFSLVKMPSLQPVVMCVMKHLPKVTAAWLALSGEGS